MHLVLDLSFSHGLPVLGAAIDSMDVSARNLATDLQVINGRVGVFTCL